MTIRPSVSFIVPALDEERLIEGTVDEIRKAVAASRIDAYQMVLVDDGSTDGTGAIMDGLAAGDARITVLHNAQNLGLGGAYRRGVTAASCDHVMMVVGDNVMPASDIGLILDRLGQADIVLGYLTNPYLRPLGRRVGSRGFTTVVNLLFGLKMHYYQAMVPRRSLLEKITIATNSHAFPAEVVVKLVKAGASFVEVGLPNTPSKRGNSVALEPRRLMSVFKTLVRLNREIRRPGAIPRGVGQRLP